MIGFEAFDEIKRLIVVAAHPDDLETMCGGTIYRLAQRGVEIFSVNCTLGDIGTSDRSLNRNGLADLRKNETETAASILGIKQTFNLGHPDGELVPDLTLRAQIANLYRQTQADTLFTFDPFWTGQIHPDHIAASQAAIDAYMPSKMFLYQPEQLEAAGADVGCLERVFLFASDRDPDVLVDVTAVYPKKIAGCLAHKTQFANEKDGLQWMKDLDAGHAKEAEFEYGERFKTLRVW
ncbi:MAG: PIG-L deacetylase family protein [Chloroflexota bacterium]